MNHNEDKQTKGVKQQSMTNARQEIGFLTAICSVKKFILVLALCLPLLGLAQTGPGGVGDSGSNIFWLDANEITGFSDGDDLNSWVDVSGNGLTLSQPSATLTPEYKTGVLNGYPVVRFNKTTGTYGRLRRTGLTNFPSTAITQFIVNKNAGESNDALTSYATTSNNNDFLIFNSSSLNIYRGGNINTGVNSNDGSWHIINPSWRSSDGETRMWFDGEQEFLGTLQTGASISTNGCFALAGEQDAVDGSYAANQAHLGDYAEVLVFNFRLNQAQRIIVNNYLAAKYAIALTGNDYYSYEATHSIDVAGIGRETATEMHTTAMSDDLLEVSNPSGLNANQEYLLFGHDNGDVTTAWTTSEAPSGGATVQRLEREWRFSESNGDVGTVDLMVDVASLPSLPAGFSSYGIMIDSDGDFSSGAVVYELGFSAGSAYDLDAINIAHGDYLAIVAIDPKVNFTTDESDDFEPNNASVEISLDYITRFDVTVDYSTADLTALTAQPDYTAVTSSTATIAAGSSTATIAITVIDEAVVEGDESFTITLSNPIAGVDLGSTLVHTYTIHDDDHARKIYFDTSTSSGLESSSPVTISLSMSSASATDVTVDYQVTGGFATEGVSNDYILSTGTVTIPGGSGATTGSFSITINDDVIFENDETIIIGLTNPTGCNLDLPSPSNVGTGITKHLHTIIENDNPPEAQFILNNSSGSEDSSPALLAVGLDAVSAVDAVISYTATDGSAISGSDYLLATGTVSIPAGSTAATVFAAIIDDGLEELQESFTITLTSAINATLGSNTVHTFTIIDDDSFGYTGPGGVGSVKNNKLWVSADHGIYNNASTTLASNGDRAQEWHDRSGNDYDLTQPNTSYRPTYANNAVNGLPAMRFNVTNNRIRRKSFADFPTTSVTTISVSKTSNSSDALVSYATSSDNNNYLLFNSANQATYIAGTSASSGHSYADETWHIIGHTWTNAGGDNRLYEDGSLVYNGIQANGRSITAGGCLALGGEQDAVDGGYSTAQDYQGDMAESIIYNLKLNTAQLIIVENYLAAKYDLTVKNDLFTHQATHGHEVAGIGRIDANNFHQDAQGSAIMRILNPSGLSNDEFMIWGHDNGLQQAIESSDVPGSVKARFDRVWRVSELNLAGTAVDVGSIDMNWDLSELGPVVASDLRLLIDTDNDGVFTDETPIAGATSLGGNIYQFSNVSALSNNRRFTLGTIDIEQTPLPIELLSFTAKLTADHTVKLDWETASETNNDYFTVERSANGTAWEDILETEGAGNSSAILGYTEFDNAPIQGTSYYRLKQTDYDGAYSHSNLAVITLQHNNDILIYPNPVTDLFTLVGHALELDEIRILNALGQDVSSQTSIQRQREERVLINASRLTEGVYLVKTKTSVSKIYKR